jgi:glycosyltransferase involved in cell wall biosynthesis
VDDVDSAMVISQFGVDAMKRAGRHVELCPPGVDTHYFKPATPEEKKALRAKAEIPSDAFLLGMAAMNQGRKDIPHTLDGFARFSIDKPNAYLLMDMDKANPAGWNIPSLMKTKGIPENKVLFKEDLAKKGLTELRDRYVILDAHSVLSHREGFGLPLIESQACKIPTIALEWCSGTEICGNGKGYLVRRLPQPRNSTWGNAFDYDPDVEHFVQILETIYTQPIQAAAIAEEGYRWAIQRTWDKTADSVEKVLLEVEEKINARKRGRASVRTASTSSEVSEDHAPISAEAPAGRIPDGRPQPKFRSAGDPGSALQRVQERDEQRVLRDGERGSETSSG